jgi:signal transduction histidine kinase/transcriptional regulator of acetoin/glycerol metabolism
MPSPWLAVGLETDPLSRARQLQRSWERLLGEGAFDTELAPDAMAGLRPTIIESWRRSLGTGLDPTGLVVPIEADPSAVRERWLEHPLGSLGPVLAAQLGEIAEESQSLVVVSDAAGLLLRIDGAESLKARAAEMNFLEGARFTEAAAGTNGIGTPLAADHALQVFAFEHFNESHHQWFCSGAPVHDPVSGQIVGLVDLSSLWKIAHPRSLELVSAAARTMERCLLDNRRDQDARLRRRYGDLMTRSTDLLVDRDGYVLDGDEPRRRSPLEVPNGGGEIVLGDGSAAVAEALGTGEAYLVRRPGSRGAKSIGVQALERAEKRARELATEQAALRQVATLVARESSPDQLLTVVANQAARVFDVALVKLVRYEEDSSVVLGGFSEGMDDPFAVGSHWSLDSPGVIASVRQSGRPARVGDYARMPGPVAAVVRRSGIVSAVASPIVVEGRLWGAIVIASSRPEPLPEDTEARLIDFAELVATAVANLESRAALRRIAEEQAALRRVAELVARQAPPEQVFAVVTEELSRLLEVNMVRTIRLERDGTATVVGAHGITDDRMTGGTNFPVPAGSVVEKVFRTGRPARVDDFAEVEGVIGAILREQGAGAGVAGPIVVEGRLWGAMAIGGRSAEALPPGSEERVAQFAELVSTAISNVESRAKVERLATEQSALRRVATLVAREHSPDDLFATLAEEIGVLLEVDGSAILRYEQDSTATVVAGWSAGTITIPVGERFPLDGENLAGEVHRTGWARRREGYEAAAGPIAATVRGLGIRAAVASPIVVDGAVWGMIAVLSRNPEPLPLDTEARLAEFSRHAGIAVANDKSSSDLAESRARIVRAGDEARRRFERDLHDGAQQRLVSLALEVRSAEATLPPGLDDVRHRLSRLGTGLNEVLANLRELSRGLHPAVLSEDGLTPALSSLALRSAVPVDLRLDLGTERFAEPIEVAAYYVASEALTNTAKHAQASRVEVTATQRDSWLEVIVRDDGRGGAVASSGSGLTGLADRVEAIGGTIHIDSPAGLGTAVRVKLPIK